MILHALIGPLVTSRIKSKRADYTAGFVFEALPKTRYDNLYPTAAKTPPSPQSA